jgi:Na+:H+ antiporter, NhaA family
MTSPFPPAGDRPAPGAGRRRRKPLPPILRKMLDSEAAPGIVLMVLAAAAMLAANSVFAHGYHALFNDPLPWTPIAKLTTLHYWINDALMAIFFFVVGLEIKREIVDGALAHPATRRLPIIAAIAGMAVPALVYLGVAAGDPQLHRGWAIPAATDIAFAMGVLALVGRRAPPGLRLFLLTVAIVDDIGAVVIIALFYSASLSLGWIAAAAAILLVMIVLNRRGITALPPYLLLAAALWFAVLHSGVHATVAGVSAALTVPLALNRGHDSPLLRLEHALVPWTGFLIVPLFGFANAGVSLNGAAFDNVSVLPWAIALGLVIGKQAGILASLYAAHLIGGGRPAGASWPQIWGMALLCGVGFTMSLFIASLAFPGAPELVEQAKLGILGGSLVSALAGFIVLRLSKASLPASSPAA